MQGYATNSNFYFGDLGARMKSVKELNFDSEDRLVSHVIQLMVQLLVQLN